MYIAEYAVPSILRLVVERNNLINLFASFALEHIIRTYSRRRAFAVEGHARKRTLYFSYAHGAPIKPKRNKLDPIIQIYNFSYA